MCLKFQWGEMFCVFANCMNRSLFVCAMIFGCLGRCLADVGFTFARYNTFWRHLCCHDFMLTPGPFPLVVSSLQ